MKISIITVSFNSERTIKHTIESVLNQTYQNFEYIIVDGQSTDNTVEIIKNYEKFFGGKLKWVSEKDRGLYDAMNKGIEMATGDVISILNSDDVYYDNKVLDNIISKFISEKCDILYSDVLFFKEQGGARKILRKWIAKEGNLFLGWIPPHPGVFVKKEIYEKYGFYDISYKIASDYDFLFRVLSKKDVKIYYYNNFTVKMKIGGKSTGSIKNIIQGNKEIYKSLRSRNIKFPLVIVFLRFIRKLHQFFI